MDRFYINVPFSQKEEAKKIGAKWDPINKAWYYTKNTDANKFSKWKRKIIPENKPEESNTKIKLSEEQEALISLAKEGKNVLVDACIGSGKTTTIQVLCNELPNKRILYLTYNRLLKQDAKEKIKNKNVFVTNYHGFAYTILKKEEIKCGISDLIQQFLKNKDKLSIPRYDVLILDEYQDIEQELAEMLWFIKKKCPKLQIIAVGDMKQKIYDKTTLNVPKFISDFLDEFTVLNFTQCFRLSKSHATNLGLPWEKVINGVNENCKVEEITLKEAIEFLKNQEPGDILCLGSRNGKMSEVLNDLEELCPDKFNKDTVYASITDEDRDSVVPGKDVAIFTTYDSSKGLERKICVVFDFTKSYLQIRLGKPNTNPEILKNIFCVAASRGKERILFVKDNEYEKTMPFSELSMMTDAKNNYDKPFNMSDMFSFKYKEDVEKCYQQLEIEEIKTEDDIVISVKNNDGLIDLSPCIGILQEASFFTKYNIDDEIEHCLRLNDDKPRIPMKDEATLEDKVLYLTAYETSYNRYINQVTTPFVDEETLGQIHDRLKTIFTPNENVQEECQINFSDDKDNEISIEGRADVVKDDIVYELKFVSELSHEHYLQCACYVVALGLNKGILWNVKNNKMYSIKIPNVNKFLKLVVKTITKGTIAEAHKFHFKKRKK